MLRLGVIVFLFSLGGCATVETISSSKRGVKIDGTYCEEIQHVMSGTNYNICKMYGEPKDTDGIHTRQNLEWLWLDSIFSFGADIVVLPYTVFKQFTAPPITVKFKS